MTDRCHKMECSVGLLLLLALVAAAAAVHGPPVRRVRSPLPVRPLPSVPLAPFSVSPPLAYNVLDYGAKGDNASDNTVAFTAAITAAAAAGGGTVFAPSGLYRFQGSLNVVAGVTLRGSFTVIPSHDVRDGAKLVCSY